MSIAISGEERNALYERIVMQLNGIDGVYRAIEEEDWERAQRLGQEFSDLLRFVCEDLGWGENAASAFQLQTPPDVLARAAGAVREMAKFDVAQFESERRDAEEREAEARNLQQICERLLEEIQPRGG